MKKNKTASFWLAVLFVAAAVIGSLLGLALAETRNIINSEYITTFDNALPTKLLDINGELITEFVADEKREIITLNKLPQHMLDALLTREDRIFYSHRGFSFKALMRAVVGQVMRRSLGGGSTLTQQLAGTIYCDRSDKSVVRKLRELWWAIQMERRFSKNEILELYLNKIYFGGGTYGVNAASKYYFGHSAEEITPAEAAILVIQLSNPAFYNPFDHPNIAMERQKSVLKSMVAAGYITKADADRSFDDFWADFDYTRTSASAYMMKDDKAPWFSEYVRRELGKIIYGSQNIYTSGLTINTTLDLRHQYAAEKVMEQYIERANRLYQQERNSRSSLAYRTYIPMAELLALTFNLPAIKLSEQRAESLANSVFLTRINPVIDVMSLVCGIDSLKVGAINKANSLAKKRSEKTTIEGTMISIENETGYITALVGGSKFDQENQFIRAAQAKLQPGSTFKPLYYTEAINSRKFTPVTEISDTPVVFHTADGKPYIPQNYFGAWKGNVQLWYALIRSLNIPSLKVLDGIGFEAAINRTVSLLGIPKEEVPTRGFTPGYPLGLGVCSVKPIELARAYSVIASGGKEITPIAVRTVEDKNGNIILNPERQLREAMLAKKEAAQTLSPQTAFVMTKLLQQTVQAGSLAAQSKKFIYKTDSGKQYVMPAGGKTGTTQNWADAWTAGFTPYYTSVFWFGFDMPGQSLGLNITGASLAGHAWGDFMEEVHAGLIAKDFPQPMNGVARVTVCSETGLLPTSDCGNHITSQWFLSGTQPTAHCSLHSNKTASNIAIYRLKRERYQSGQNLRTEIEYSPLKLNLDFLNGGGESDAESPNADTPSEAAHEEFPEFNPLME